MEKLMNGENLYLKGSKGYIGKTEYIGPYGEEEVFSSEYSSQNIGINELMIGLEKSVERGEVKALRLPKMGNHFND